MVGSSLSQLPRPFQTWGSVSLSSHRVHASGSERDGGSKQLVRTDRGVPGKRRLDSSAPALSQARSPFSERTAVSAVTVLGRAVYFVSSLMSEECVFLSFVVAVFNVTVRR